MVELAITTHLPARLTELEGTSRSFPSSHLNARSASVTFAKVNFPQGDLPKELEPKWNLFTIQKPCVSDVLIFLEDKHILLIEFRVSLLVLVVRTTSLVLCSGDHLSHLSRVRRCPSSDQRRCPHLGQDCCGS